MRGPMRELGMDNPAALTSLPIFPLPNCVLLPGGLLPLHVYEKCGVGRIICSEELPDGRFALLLRGVARAEIARELPAHRTYRLVEAHPLDDAWYDPIDAHDHLRRLISLCDQLAEVLKQGALRDLV